MLGDYIIAMFRPWLDMTHHNPAKAGELRHYVTDPDGKDFEVDGPDVPPPSEEKTKRLAAELGEDPDVLLAMAGKVSKDLQDIIRKRPKLFADLIRELKEAPDHAILRVVREVRDGDW
jgi:hypothetical protein